MDQISGGGPLAARRNAPDLFSDLYYAPHPATRLEKQGCDLGDAQIIAGPEGLRRAATVLGMFASLMTDAFLGGRRVISVQPKAGPNDMSPLSRHGLIPRATTVEGLIACLRDYRGASSRTLRMTLANSCERLESLLAEMAAP